MVTEAMVTAAIHCLIAFCAGFLVALWFWVRERNAHAVTKALHAHADRELALADNQVMRLHGENAKLRRERVRLVGPDWGAL